MAQVLTVPRTDAAVSSGWWPVDYLITGYLSAMAVLLLWYRRGLPDAWVLLGLHALGVGLIVLAAACPAARWSVIFRHWYPLPYVACCYKEMSLLIPATGRVPRDAELASLDYGLWGANPTVWLERIANPWTTEILQICYSLFVPAVLVVAVILWRQRRFPDFRFYAFLIALGFLVSYVGYLLVPARGPRFLLAHLQSFELRGVWSFDFLQHLLNRLESSHYDCFPSGHTELTILAWWGSRRISKNLGRFFFVYTLTILLATVYLRYHYTVDIFAGVATAALVAVAAAAICDEGFIGRVRGGTGSNPAGVG